MVSILIGLQGMCKSQLVLVDDGATTDDSPSRKLAALLRNARVLWPHTAIVETKSGGIGRGYAPTVEAGLAVASGDFLLLVNNDIMVFPSALRVMRDTFRVRRRVGAVVARFLRLDGTLQEAGSAVFSDGSAVQFSNLWGSTNSLFRYTRPVDYGSAACLMLRTELLAQGFDRIFLPAYYEDTDLAMRILHNSRFTVEYQPFAVVLHAGSATYGAPNEAKSMHMEKNKAAFAKKWSSQLTCHYDASTLWSAAPGGAMLPSTRLSTLRMLVIDATVPCVMRDSGSVRLFNFLRILLGRRYHVTLAAIDLDPDDICSLRLNMLGVRVISTSELKLSSVSGVCDYNLAMLSRRSVAESWMQVLRLACPETPIIFDTVDLHLLREFREIMMASGVQYDAAQSWAENVAAAHRARPALARSSEYHAWEQSADAEVKLMNSSDITIVVSPTERTLLAELKHDHYIRSTLPIAIVSNIHDIDMSHRHRTATDNLPFGERHGALFVGNWQHPPNLDAVRFLQEILSQTDELEALPDDFVIHIAGAGLQPVWLQELERIGRFEVINHGFVKSLRMLYSHCRVALAPLRYGAGVKGKVNSAMIEGLPVVATSIAIEGMHIRPDFEALVGDAARSFAKQLAAVYSDEALWSRVASAARDSVFRYFSIDRAARQIDAFLTSDLMSPQSTLARASHEGRYVFDPERPCNMYGKFHIGTFAAHNHILDPETSSRMDYVELSTPNNVVLVSSDPNQDLKFWRIASHDLFARCSAYDHCTGVCHHPTDMSMLYLSNMLTPLPRGEIDQYPPGWRCHLKGSVAVTAARVAANTQDEARILVVPMKVGTATNLVFSGRVVHSSWKISESVAANHCVGDKDCTGYCHNPLDHTFFYTGELSTSNMYARGEIGQYPPGWTCHLGQMRPGSSDGESLARYLPSYLFDRHSQARRFENGQRTNTKKTTPMKQGRMQKRRKVFARRRKIRKQGTAL